MFGAGATGEDELLFESLACAVRTYSGVAGSDAGFLREGLECIFGEVDFADNLAVCRFEFVEDVVDALTNDLLGGGVELAFDGEILGPLLQSTVFGGTVAVVVDDGIAQDAVEPGDGGLVAAQGCCLLHGANIGGLDDVLGDSAGSHSSFNEVEELSSLVEESGERGSCHGVLSTVRAARRNVRAAG